MSSLSMVEEKLPAGFRFHPRDEELICDYLINKISHHSHNNHSTLLIHVDLNKSEPWEIPESACVGGKEWYFYSQRDRKYSTGLRTNRATSSGYWKATGKDRPVLSSKGKGEGEGKGIVGMRKTLVFYQGRAPKGTKTDWVMHEFRVVAPPISPLKEEDWVLCRVFYKSREMGITKSFNFNTLPALSLMDNHHQPQVPCFSNNIHLPPKNDIFFNHIANSESESELELTPAGYDTDNELLKAVLNQLTNMESNPISSEEATYLSQFGTPNIWSHY